MSDHLSDDDSMANAPKPGGKANGHAHDQSAGHEDNADDYNDALAFLKAFNASGPWALTAISPDGVEKIEGRSFRPATDEAALREWIAARNGKKNLYFHPNPVRQGFRGPKAARRDIDQVGHLHVDIDPRDGKPLADERRRILHSLTDGRHADVPQPTWTNDSGNGYQAYWRLEEPFEVGGDEGKASEIERYNRQLAALLGGDKCHSIEHLMRLPGTINVPDTKKKDKGRVAAAATVVERNDVAYDLSAFRLAPPNAASGAAHDRHAGDDEAQRVEIVDLDKWGVSERVKTVIKEGSIPDEPKKDDNSRSAWLFDVVCNLLRCKVPDDVIFSIITDPRYGISESVLERGAKAKEYALKQIAKAKEQVALDDDTFVMDAKDHGKVAANHQHNIRLAAHKLGIKLSHDVFRGRYLITGLEGVGPLLDDAAANRLYLTIDERFNFRPVRQFFDIVISDAAERAPFHPVCDYLASLHWDGTPRLDKWLTTYGGALDTAYVRAVAALMLIAAVRRVRWPGCKFDEMLVLESEQGTNKSSALAALAVREDWFSDQLPLNADDKRVIEVLQGRFIVEAAELSGMRKGEVEHVKALLSRQVDRARLSYARFATEAPRQCIIIGTTNSSQYLRDGTGARRFWPVRVTKFKLEALRRDRDQIWAEAAQREAAGESIRMNPALYDAAAHEQEDRRVEDPYVSAVKAVLGELRGKVLNEDAWTILGIPVGQRSQDHNKRLGDAMRELGWERVKLRFGGPNPEWCYARGTHEQRKRRVFVNRDPSDGKVVAAVGEEAM